MATIHDLITKATLGEETVFDVVGDMKSTKLTVETRKLNPEAPREPKRAESPARRHEFLAAQSLADYLARYGGASTVVYADPVGEVMHACLDETAKAGYEVITMRPAIHPLWKPWSDIAGKTVTSDQFVSFIDHNRRAIVTPDGRELRMLLSQIRASVHTEIERGRGKAAVNGLVVTTKIQGVDKKEVVELPESITIHVPLYVDTAAQDVELDLTIEATSDGDISICVSAGTVSEAKVRAFGEMVEIVAGAIEDTGTGKKGGLVTFGRPQHAAWAYLAEQKPV